MFTLRTGVFTVDILPLLLRIPHPVSRIPHPVSSIGLKFAAFVLMKKDLRNILFISLQVLFLAWVFSFFYSYGQPYFFHAVILIVMIVLTWQVVKTI
ncbi:MAG TPA: hypothetical protein VHM26_13435 [Chitinophagaceae bacterium]|nr:hypothetical protein [Chitinophagaceae bacterium]